jgi:hypothetical protein
MSIKCEGLVATELSVYSRIAIGHSNNNDSFGAIRGGLLSSGSPFASHKRRNQHVASQMNSLLTLLNCDSRLPAFLAG